MRSRGLVVALALLLAVGATAAVFLYVSGVKNNAINNGDVVKVLVAQQDIPANAQLNPMIDQGVFVEKTIPTDAEVKGAVTTIDELRNRSAVAPILANEQIPAERISGGQQAAGGILGICDNCVALTVRVDGPTGVGGSIQRGDNVSLFASFDSVKGFKSVRQLIGQLNGTPRPGQAQAQTAQLPPFTMTLEPTIKVLKVENPVVNNETTNNTSQGSVTVTLDVPKQDAEYVVFAAQHGSVYFGLLPPSQQGLQLPAQSISLNRLLGKRAA